MSNSRDGVGQAGNGVRTFGRGAISRREALLGGVSLAALLAACGSDADDGATTQPTAGPSSSASPTTPPTSAGEGSTRTVKDVYGDVTVPAAPQRVILLGDTVAGMALHIGFPAERIAAVAWNERPDRTYLDHLNQYTDISKLADAGPWYEPNIEEMLRLEPDLFLNFGFADWKDDADVYVKTDVPVFTVYNGYASLDETMLFLRDVGIGLNMEAEATAAEEAFRARVAAVKAQLPATLPTVSTIRPFDDGTFYANSSPMLHALGLPGPHPSIEDMTVEYSAERLEDIDADHIFAYSSNSEGPDEVRARLEAVPTWRTLKAVQEDRVHYVPAVGWLNWDVSSMELGLADIERYLFS